MRGRYHKLSSGPGSVANNAGAAPCSGAEHSQCAGTFNAISGVIDWKFAPKWDVYIGLMRSQFNGGLSNAFIQNNNIATTAGLRFRY